MKNREWKNLNRPLWMLCVWVVFPTRDSWFFGDTICMIWVYIAAHKNHCYIWLENTALLHLAQNTGLRSSTLHLPWSAFPEISSLTFSHFQTDGHTAIIVTSRQYRRLAFLPDELSTHQKRVWHQHSHSVSRIEIWIKNSKGRRCIRTIPQTKSTHLQMRTFWCVVPPRSKFLATPLTACILRIGNLAV